MAHKKYFDIDAQQAFYDKIKTIFQTVANKVTSWSSTPSDDKYPSEKLVKDSLDAKADDSDVVHKTGTETVSGAKTFNNTSSVFGGKCANDINGASLVSAYGVFRSELGNPTLEERGIIEETFANQLECLPKANAVYETSPKGTETWTTLAVSDNTHNLLWGGDVTGSLSISKNVDFRITINAPSYCYLNFLYFYASGNGATFHIKLERKSNSSGAWTVLSDTAEAGIGWPGHETIRHSNLPFAPTGSDKFGSVRLTLYMVSTGNVESYPTYGIYKFRYYGGYPYKSDPWIVKNGSTGLTNFPKGITSGVAIPVSSGGTGQTTATAAQYALLNPKCVELTAALEDNYRIMFASTDPSASVGLFVGYRKAVAIWNYIKDKISSVLGLTVTSYGGNAATATTAAGYTSGGAIDTALQGKVDKETGKGLSTNDYTTTEKNKLAGIASGAEVNVQSDWNQSTSTADDYIKNKPQNLVQDASYVHTDNNYTTAEKNKVDSAIQPGNVGLTDYYDIEVTTSTGGVVDNDTYAAISASISAGRMVYLKLDDMPMYRYLDTSNGRLWFYSPFEELAIYTTQGDSGHEFTLGPKADSVLNPVGTNSVQNKVVTTALNDKVPTSRTVNSKALSSDISLTASDVGAVPTSRTVNGLALSSDIRFMYSSLSEISSSLSASSTPQQVIEAMSDNTIAIISVDGGMQLTNVKWGPAKGTSGTLTIVKRSNYRVQIEYNYSDGNYFLGTFNTPNIFWSRIPLCNRVQNPTASWSDPTIGSETVPVYVQGGLIKAGKNRIQAVSSLNTSTMDSEVLYVL